MRQTTDRPADSPEHSASDLIAELQAVRDSVEELYILLDHIWKNRGELHDILARLRDDASEHDDEILVCIRCDASPSSLATAVKEGWKDIQYDDGPDWNYFGICPDCVNQDASDDCRLERTGNAMGMTHEQIQQAREEKVTTELGLRRTEKNSRGDGPAEVVACARCHAASPGSLASAIQQGWTSLCRDDGQDWDYLGVCPKCQTQQNQPAEPDAPQKHFFA